MFFVQVENLSFSFETAKKTMNFPGTNLENPYSLCGELRGHLLHYNLVGKTKVEKAGVMDLISTAAVIERIDAVATDQGWSRHRSID